MCTVYSVVFCTVSRALVRAHLRAALLLQVRSDLWKDCAAKVRFVGARGSARGCITACTFCPLLKDNRAFVYAFVDVCG